MLNQEQNQVVQHVINTNGNYGPVAVLAGPGAGKTHLITVGVLPALVHDAGIEVKKILALTFNRHAADELQSRTLKYIPEFKVYSQNINTIHALCYGILKKEGFDHLRPPIQQEAWTVTKVGNGVLEDQDWGVDLVSLEDVLGWVDAAKFDGVRYEEANDWFYSRMIGRGINNPSLKAKLLSDFWVEFDQRLHNENFVLTFSDMLYMCEMLLKDNEAIRHKWSNTWTHFINDESQDTGSQTWRILDMLVPNEDNTTNLMLVGDGDQLLYRWNGANPNYMQGGFYNKYPDGTVFKLQRNHRSDGHIVKTLSPYILPNYDETNMDFFKTLEPMENRQDGDLITIKGCTSPYDEGSMVADYIEELVSSEQYAYGDFYVLARTTGYLAYVEGYLARKGIPYINKKGGSFWGMKYPRMIVDYMRLTLDQNNDEAFRSVYRFSSKHMRMTFGKKKGQPINFRILGNKFLDACEDYGDSLWEGMENLETSNHRQLYQWKAGIIDFKNTMREFRQVIEYEDTKPNQHTTTDLVEAIINTVVRHYIQIEEGSRLAEASNDTLADLQVVSEMASEFDTVQDFLEYVDNVIAEVEKMKEGDEAELVILSTVHGVKGLERNVVCGMGWSEGHLPHIRAMEGVESDGVLRPDYAPDTDTAIKDERDIGYVMISRAKERVLLSYAYLVYNKVVQPSRFLEPIYAYNEQLSNENPTNILDQVKTGQDVSVNVLFNEKQATEPIKSTPEYLDIDDRYTDPDGELPW